VTVPVWTIECPIDASLGRIASRTGIARQAGQLVCAHGAYLLPWMLAWWLVGAASLGGHLDRGWLTAWTLLLATLVPLRMAALWVQAKLAVGAGAALKERLLVGALRVDPDRVSGDEAGALLGRAIEADAVESLALTGGFSAVVAVLELVAAAVAIGAGYSLWATLPLVVWCGGAAFFVDRG